MQTEICELIGQNEVEFSKVFTKCDKKIFLSPYIDGPIKFSQSNTGELNLQNISKYGQQVNSEKKQYKL